MEKFTSIVLKNSKVILFSTVLLTVLSVWVLVKKVYIETDLDEYMPKDHPAFVYSDLAEEKFDIRDAIVIAIENPGGIYNPQTLQKVKDLTKALGKMEEIDKSDITSLYTADNIIGTEEGLEVERFYKRVPKTAEQLAALEQAVTTNEMIYGRLVSHDGKATLLVAKIDDDVFSEDFYRAVVELSDSFNGDGDRVYVAGQPIIEGTMAIIMPQDMKRMMPVVMLLIVIVLMFVLRSWKATLITLFLVVVSSIWAFAIMAGLGIPIYAPTTLIPVLLIAIGVADGIHMFNHLQLYRQKHPDLSKKELITNMVVEMWRPVVMTSVTTAVGFLTLISSDVYPIKYFAVFSALGVLFAMLLSLVVIPAGTQLAGLPRFRLQPSEANFFNRGAERYGKLMVRYRKIFSVWTVFFVAFFGYGMTKVWINSSFLERFPKSHPIVETDAFVNAHFMGTTNINVILEAEEDNAFKQPEVLRLADKMTSETEAAFAEIGGSLSINDFIKRMNKVLNEDRESYYTIPGNSDLIAQYILLYEMSGDPDNLWEVVDSDFRSGNYSLQVKTDNSRTLNAIIDYLKTYEEDFSRLGIKMNFAGSGYTSLVFNDLILIGQIKSLAWSLVIVLALLSIMFRSFKVGVIGTVPIVITTIISFGVLGWLNIPLETTTALISSIAVGVGIDYAVHFIDRYKINALATGDKDLTVKKTMIHSGRALLFNAVVVIAGFLVLLLSEFVPNKALGAIVSLNMFTSFVGTITIMFVILYMTDMYFKKKKQNK